MRHATTTTKDGSGISDAEWEVMEVLWAEAPLTSREVVERLAGVTDWSPRTVKTLLGRLVRKGALGYEVQGNRYLYTPVVAKQDAVRAEGRSFVDRVFGGEETQALLHFARQVELSKQELDDLRRLLEERADR